MFENLTWTHLAIIAAVGLLVFGPERLPGAIRWSVAALRQLRAQLTDATSGLREQFGPELDELREPLAELQRLRGMTPRAAIARHLLDGDDTVPATSDRSPAVPAVEPRHAAGSPPRRPPLSTTGTRPETARLKTASDRATRSSRALTSVYPHQVIRIKPGTMSTQMRRR